MAASAVQLKPPSTTRTRIGSLAAAAIAIACLPSRTVRRYLPTQGSSPDPAPRGAPPAAVGVRTIAPIGACAVGQGAAAMRAPAPVASANLDHPGHEVEGNPR